VTVDRNVTDVAAGNNNNNNNINLTRTKSQYHRTHPGRLVNFSSFRVSNRHHHHNQQQQQQLQQQQLQQQQLQQQQQRMQQQRLQQQQQTPMRTPNVFNRNQPNPYGVQNRPHYSEIALHLRR